jgi:hypothetical protein
VPQQTHPPLASHLRGGSGFRGDFGQPQLGLPGSTLEAGSTAITGQVLRLV